MGDEIGEDIQAEGHNSFTATQLAKARTVAFIALVWSENVRAYTSRSFDKLFVVDILSNKHMQRAIGLAQAALYLALFLPGLSDILELEGVEIDSMGWLAALVGAVATLVLCEASKLVRQAITPQKMEAYASGNAGILKGGEAGILKGGEVV